ncbi:MAG: biotin/lipoyl-binding protein [Candidatus Pacebacteria bacterium]|nr:biotin/lipoyl-binding protein [Candidatus Paceibacterota bacterium]
MKFKFNNQGKDYDIEIAEAGGKTLITVNGKEFSFGEERQAAVAAVPQTIIPKRDMSSKEVRAVLAGVITEIGVKAGDIVKTGQKLLTLSAMKMENEILAECDGMIKEIKVAKDQKVKEGDTLITLA